MPKRVNPEDADISVPEMHGHEDLPLIDVPDEETVSLDEVAEEEREAEAAEPVSAEKGNEASVRRSRREGKKDRPAVNLDDIEEFRKFKAEADRRLAEERKRREELERQYQEHQAELAERRKRELADRLAEADMLDDPNEKQRLLDEYARAVWEQNQAALRRWQQAKRELLEQMGLDPSDSRFADENYADDPNTAWYRLERDAAKAAAEHAKEEARRAKAMLEDLPTLVKREVARIATASGIVSADLGEDSPSAPLDDDQWQRDVRLVQTGRMSPEQYLRKWRKR